VTRRYAIFGPGRVGRNVAAFVTTLGHEATLISRAEAADRRAAGEIVGAADVVCAALPDDVLSGWAEEWATAARGRPAIHFSGARLFPGLWSYHPLYSFPQTILPPETLLGIAFARQEGAPPLAEIFPGAENPEFLVRNEDRALYHALAVLSGNFASAIWNESARAFAGRLGVDPAVLAPYLAGVVERFAESPLDSLTGPIARRDRETVRMNLEALKNEPKLAALYRAFLTAWWPEFDRGGAGGRLP
jgi:hypothetical protein